MENGVVVEEGPSKEFFRKSAGRADENILQNIEQHYE